MAVVIKGVSKKSPAMSAGIKSGDVLLSIDGFDIIDVLDYRFYQNNEELLVSFINKRGKIKTKRVKKSETEELGLEFETYLMDTQRHCKNKCIFCFIDQLPKGMRQSLYFKDDDSRLSFLFGNYITLTNITEHEIERIIKMHISPINISVHTTNPELRVKMMKNKDAGKLLSIISRFDEAAIDMNCQLVLVPEYNDGKELERSLLDLIKIKSIKSIAAVPVGLTAHREGLEQLKPFDKQSALSVLEIMDKYSAKSNELYCENRVFAADEFFILAEREIPKPCYYGSFLQLENGVGLWALMKQETIGAINYTEPQGELSKISVATGEEAYPLISELIYLAKEKYPLLDCAVYPIRNKFFGGHITVAGLVTGQDIIEQLSDKDLGEYLLIPSAMLRHENDKFLDDITVEELEKKLGVKVKPVNNNGYDFVDALLCIKERG